jgi:5-oxoprolinase (ATP-hydrolysing) subunit A
MTTIDLNSDMGEGFGVYTLGDDAAMLEIVTSANIACGFHAGDPLTMATTLAHAKANGVGAGAHPSFLDLWGFGRRPIMGERPEDVEKHLIYQIGALQVLAHSAGMKLQHVKTHGSLGNIANEDAALARAVARAIKAVDPNLIFIVMPGLETERAGEAEGLRIAREIYADRAYADNGNLISRKLPGAVIHEPDLAAERVLRMVEDSEIVTASGKHLKAHPDTVCVHGDTHGAVEMARRIKARLKGGGIVIRPLGEWLA